MAESKVVPLRVSVVVPVYDSPDLDLLTDSLEEVLEACTDEYEIIFVDDASPSGSTWTALERLSRERRHVRAVQLARNFGQQPATLCGLRECIGDFVITIDDDLQHDPADIPQLLEQRHHDVVIGQISESAHSRGRRIASNIKGLFDRIVLRVPRGLRLSSFRLLNRTVVDGVLAMRTPHPFLPALMFHVSRDVVGVPVRHSPRAGGTSGYDTLKLLRLFSNLIINNSSILLRAAASTGIAIACLSFVLGTVVVYRKVVYGTDVQGWTSLFAALTFIGGLLLMTVGVIGEYLIRIIETVEAKPMYFVRRRTGKREPSDG